jgi:L-malate glycosyltransferase
MRKTKVLFLINDLLPGGAQRVVLDIASNINHDLYDPVVVSLRNAATLHGGMEPMDHEFSEAGIRVLTLGWNGHPSVSEFLDLMRMIRRESPDIIHAHLPYSVILGTIAARLAGVRRIIAHEHNTREFDPFLIRFLRALVAPFVDLVICYTDEVEHSLFGDVHTFMAADDDLLSGRVRSLTVFNGIDTQKVLALAHATDRDGVRNELGVSHGEILVVAVGRLVSWKGHEHLVRAFARVISRRKDIKLRIAGYGPMEDTFRDLILKQGLASHVSLLGARADAVALMRSADIISNVYTYEPGTAVQEAAGLAGLEALTTGTPVILGDYPSTARIAPGGIAAVVDPYDEEALAKTIEHLADNPAERIRLGAAASHFMQEAMDVRKVAGRYERVYAWLCTPR